jgi:guanine deaminase
MDQNAPAFYIEPTVEQSVNDTRAFIDYLQAKKSTVVPVVTPRFAPACTVELLKSLGDIAAEYNLPVQTHLCENQAEVAWVG